MQLVRAHLLVTGRVQGVFYRAFTRDIAVQLGLKGWVRNLSDGSVEVVVEGEKGDIERMARQCHSGPPGARVDEVRTDWEDFQGDLREFQIRYY